MSITDEQFANLIGLPHEHRGVEFKGPGPREGHLLAKVVRAVLGMANRSGGGSVIIGIEENAQGPQLLGLTPEQLEQWRHYDEVAQAIARYADPPIHFNLEVRAYKGQQFILLDVQEFDDIPIVCKRAYTDGNKTILRDGACYVRGMRKIETVEISSHAEMRDLLERATLKRLQRFVAQTRTLGINLIEGAELHDDAFFARELADWKTPFLEEIHSRGYWQVIIRPARYLKDRIRQLPVLSALLEAHAVRDRGWDFPHIESKSQMHFDVDWIGQELAYDHLLEVWRFSQSGQFVHVAGFEDDWLDRANPMWLRPQPGWTPNTRMAVEGVVYRCTEVFRLAARLAADERFHADRQMHIDIGLIGLRDRALYYERPGIFSTRELPHAEIPEYSYQVDVLVDDLIADFDALALQAAAQIFHRFHWEPTEAGLRNIQFGIGK